MSWLLLLLACGGAAPVPSSTQPPASPADCARYAEPELRGYCLVMLAEARPALGAGLCAGAGTWAGECRRAWVARSLEEAPTDVLLAACAGDPDCAFSVLDARPEGGLMIQLDRCALHAGRFEQPCQEHATARWVASRPDAEALDALAADGRYPAVVAEGIARRVACEGQGRCEDWPEAHRGACARIVADIGRNPGICGQPPER